MVLQTGLLYRTLLYLRYGEGVALDLAQEIADAFTSTFREIRMAQNDIDDTTRAIQADVNQLRGMYQQMLERQQRTGDLINQLEQTRASLQAQLANFTQANPNTAMINELNALTGIREQLDSLRADTQQALAGTPNTPAPTPPQTTPTLADFPPQPPTTTNPPPPDLATGTTPATTPTPQPAPADATGTQMPGTTTPPAPPPPAPPPAPPAPPAEPTVNP